MPSRLVSTNPVFRERDLARARALTQLQSVAARGPFMGYVPDLPVHHLDMNAARNINSLVARSLSLGDGEGEVLMLDSGWVRATQNNPATIMGVAANMDAEIVHLAMFPRTDDSGAKSVDGSTEYEDTPIAILAGDGSTENTCEMWRILPSTGDWTIIAHTNHGGADTERPKGDRDALPDSATFASGWPDRDSDGDFSGSDAAADGIDEPCFLWTNNIDPVYVFPADSDVAALNDQFEDLTEDALLDPFRCKSLEVFANRVYFLNTEEAGTRYRQRLRRTPPFTCNPAPAQVGAGSSDLKDFAGQGLRAERLGNVLALYFEDGVSFMRPTGVATAPDSFQTISTSRGLISTHSLTNLGNDLHFGIFTDGWFELDPSGRFREVGIANVGGIPHHKWKETFYSLLGDTATKRNRLYIQYHTTTDRIYIALPTDAEDENTRVWIYDRKSDRVFLDTYEVICWGLLNRPIVATGMTYASSAPETYASIAPATYASVGSDTGFNSLVHGTSNGYVFQHSQDSATRALEQTTGNQHPTYLYETPFISGLSPRFLMTVDRALVEYINVGSPDMTARVSSKDSSESTTVAINAGSFGDVRTGQAFYRFTGQQMSLRLSGLGPVMLKSFEADVYEEQVEPR